MSTYLGEPDKILVHPRFSVRSLPARSMEELKQALLDSILSGKGWTVNVELPQLHGEIWQTVDRSGSRSSKYAWLWYAVCMHCRAHSNAYKRPNRWPMQWAVRHRCVPTLYVTGADQ